MEILSYLQVYNLDLDSKKPKLLILSTLWIEPESSAAGYRLLQILSLYKDAGYDLHYATTAKASEFAYTDGLICHSIQVNDSSFDQFIKDLNPSAVLYDRFMVEEQFGWRVRKQCPQIPQILDTEDLHFLRKARHEAVKADGNLKKVDEYLYSELAQRELSAIMRCDLSIMISRIEIDLLVAKFSIDRQQLVYLPFIHKQDLDAEAGFPGFTQRKNFMAIGNLIHAPNWDSVLELKRLWPQIRKETKAELHIYGAYPSQKVWQLHKPEEGFVIKGRAESVVAIMQEHRVLLAPLRFGAGQKGKLFDAMKNGLPSVTSPIGAESMQSESISWPGAISSSDQEFIEQAIELYRDQNIWESCQAHANTLLQEKFSGSQTEEFRKSILEFSQEELLNKHRKKFFLTQVFNSDQQARYKYLSKYIALKNESKTPF
ncbi:MAG: glycosyltransferase [Flavobacteriaceae bacterium]